jgi:hypothetical protein
VTASGGSTSVTQIRSAAVFSTVRKNDAVLAAFTVSDGANELQTVSATVDRNTRLLAAKAREPPPTHFRCATAVTRFGCGDITASFTCLPRSTMTKLVHPSDGFAFSLRTDATMA